MCMWTWLLRWENRPDTKNRRLKIVMPPTMLVRSVQRRLSNLQQLNSVDQGGHSSSTDVSVLSKFHSPSRLYIWPGTYQRININSSTTDTTTKLITSLHTGAFCRFRNAWTLLAGLLGSFFTPLFWKQRLCRSHYFVSVQCICHVFVRYTRQACWQVKDTLK